MADKIHCFIGLGSNMGDAAGNIQKAIGLMGDSEGISVVATAPYYRSAPVGYKEQDYFMNTVVEIVTVLTPMALLANLQEIENNLGRVRTVRWGPRTIDLDILLYGNAVIGESNLMVPHPRMHERAFVMVPLADLRPDLMINGQRAKDLALLLSKEQEVYKSLF